MYIIFSPNCCCFMPGLFTLALVWRWRFWKSTPRREGPVKQSPPGSVFCLRNNFFVGRLAVFSSEGSIAVDTFFTKALSRRLSPFYSRTGVAGDKNRGWRIREKSSCRDIGKQKRAEGRYYPSQNKPTRVTVEITLGIQCSAEVISSLM